MAYIVECRVKDEEGNITGVQFRGFGAGLPNKKEAEKVFNREVQSDRWDAVYIDKVCNGVTIKCWYKKK